MRKLLIIFLVSFVFVTMQGQKINRSFTADTAKGSTIYFEYENTSFTNPLDYYNNGIVGFFFSKTNVTDSLSTLQMQGSFDGTNYVDIEDTTAKITDGTELDTDGNYFLYEIKSKFTSYRLKATAANGDTTILQNVKFIYKEED